MEAFREHPRAAQEVGRRGPCVPDRPVHLIWRSCARLFIVTGIGVAAAF
ncbi:hypothetical protein [Streptomyces sp. NPDC016675]